MITHNGKYLSVATHHGMPIYAATMGGKMVIRPWLLSATLQAIVAAFGAEGTEGIRKTNDYLNRIAITDPQRALLLANFINEDPMLVCSLVETSKVRTLDNTSNGFIKSPMVVTTANLLSLRIEIEAQYHNSTSLPSWASYGYDVPNLEFGYDNASQFVIGQPNNTFVRSGKNDSQYAVKMMRYIGDYKNRVAQLYEMDGTRIYNLAITGNVTITFYGQGYGLFQSVGSGGAAGNQNCKSKIKSTKFYIDDVLQYWLVPFVRNGVQGLIDLVEGNFYTSANSATFTIALTPKTTS